MANRPQVRAITKNLTMLIDTIDAAANKSDFPTGLQEKEFITSAGAFAAQGVSFKERLSDMIKAVTTKIQYAKSPQQLFEKFIQIVERVAPGTAIQVIETYKLQVDADGDSSVLDLLGKQDMKPAVPVQQLDDQLKPTLEPAVAQQPAHKRHRMETDSGSKPRVPCYRMSQKPHGVAIIINNVHFFDPKVLSTRDGSDTDSNNLERTLKGLGYKPVMVLEDRKGDQITRAFRDVCEMDHSKHDSFVCCLLSHGMEGAVYGKDGQLVKIRDLSKKLARCEGLQGKPKIFFIQTCQGSDKPEELKKDDDKHDPDKDVASLPRDSDFFFGYATSPETVALRNEVTGTWYIHELCQVLEENKHDLVTMVTLVHNTVATEDKYRYPVEDKITKKVLHYYRQQPQLVSTLRHQVKF